MYEMKNGLLTNYKYILYTNDVIKCEVFNAKFHVIMYKSFIKFKY